MSMKRVLVLDPAGLLWGSERALLDFIGEIPGYEAACCCPAGTPLVSKLTSKGIVCFPTFQENLHLRGKVARLRALWGLISAMIRFKPDVLHVNQAGATRIALTACRILSVPCISHVRLQEDVAYLNRLKPSPRHLRGLISVSQPISELLENQEALRSIPKHTLLDAYRTSSTGESDRQSLPARDLKWDFVCVGRMAAGKGQEKLLRALAVLKMRGRQPKVAFVGEVNAHGESLRLLADKLGLTGAVTFLGHSDRVMDVLRQAQWLICPSEYESLGRVLFEAWDTGIPVIAGRTSGGAAASIQASQGGLLFQEWTPEAIAAAMDEAVMMNGESMKSLVNRGRNWLEAATDPRGYATAMADILNHA